MPKLWVRQVCELEELGTSALTGVVSVTPNVLVPVCIQTAVSKIRQAGFGKKILIFSPPDIRHIGKEEMEGVYYFNTADMTEIINSIRAHCLLFL